MKAAGQTRTERNTQRSSASRRYTVTNQKLNSCLHKAEQERAEREKRRKRPKEDFLQQNSAMPSSCFTGLTLAIYSMEAKHQSELTSVPGGRPLSLLQCLIFFRCVVLLSGTCCSASSSSKAATRALFCPTPPKSLRAHRPCFH